MKSVQFDEEQMPDLKQIAQALFEDETDPRSSSYQRILLRPKINWLLFVGWLLIPAVFVLLFLHLSGSIPVMLIVLVLYACITAKRMVIFWIQVYQRYAPDALRLKCRFEPSCSEYMMQSIRKYGLLKGLYAGIKRLRRCNIHGGGFDYP